MVPSVRPCVVPSAGRCSPRGPAGTAARHDPLKGPGPAPAPPRTGAAPSPKPPPPRRSPRPAPQTRDVHFLEFLARPGDKPEFPGLWPARNRRPRDAGLEPPVGSGSSRLAGSASRLAPRAAFKLPPGLLQRAGPSWKPGTVSVTDLVGLSLYWARHMLIT